MEKPNNCKYPNCEECNYDDCILDIEPTDEEEIAKIQEQMKVIKDSGVKVSYDREYLRLRNRLRYLRNRQHYILYQRQYSQQTRMGKRERVVSEEEIARRRNMKNLSKEEYGKIIKEAKRRSQKKSSS